MARPSAAFVNRFDIDRRWHGARLEWSGRLSGGSRCWFGMCLAMIVGLGGLIGHVASLA